MEKWKTRVSAAAGMLLLILAMAIAGGCGTAEGTKTADTKDKAQSSTNAGADAGVSAFSMEQGQEAGELTVQFLDVGQGGAALISQNGEYMLVDGGDRDYSSFVVSCLKQQGVTRLSYVVVSHYDADHLNGVVGVLNALECDKVLAPDYEGDTKVYQSFLNVIQEKNIPLEYPALGDDYAFADGSFRVVSPVSYEYSDDNSNSLGIRLAYGENSFLLCGDSTEDSEADLLNAGVDVKSDVFIANHHGSKYSNSEDFLEAVSPGAVVISCGKGNSYGHPDAAVLLTVQKLGANLYRTDLQGSITAVSDGSSITFLQEPCMDYRSGPELFGEGASQTDDRENAEEAENSTEEQNDTEAARDYVLNTSTMKFHLPACSSAETIKEGNREDTHDTRDNVMAKGYSPCKRCNP